MIRKSSRARAKLLCTSHFLIVKLHKPSKNKPKDLFPNIFPTKRLPHNFQRILLTNVVIFLQNFLYNYIFDCAVFTVLSLIVYTYNCFE